MSTNLHWSTKYQPLSSSTQELIEQYFMQNIFIYLLRLETKGPALDQEKHWSSKQEQSNITDNGTAL
jgi:hypothetical protein